jgi:hypothetical protein
MKSSIIATLRHCASTDQEPMHNKCPEGENSWCFYNRAIAKKLIPGSHDQNIKTPISTHVLKHIAPIYKRLSDEALLQKCIRGQTQNRNESLHSNIWKYCNKSKFTSLPLLQAAVSRAVSEFNFGNLSHMTIMTNASLSPGRKTMTYARQRDIIRKRRIARIKSSKYQERKRKLRLKTMKREEKKIQKEGITYGPGQF